MRTLSALVFATLASGCFGPASHVDSNATLSVGGVAQRQDGVGDAAAKRAADSASGRAASHRRRARRSSAPSGSPASPATTASVIRTRRRPPLPDGSYTFGPIRGADTQGSTGEALLFSAWLSGPPSTAPATAPAGVDADFYIQKTQVTVPTAAALGDGRHRRRRERRAVVLVAFARELDRVGRRRLQAANHDREGTDHLVGDDVGIVDAGEHRPPRHPGLRRQLGDLGAPQDRGRRHRLRPDLVFAVNGLCVAGPRAAVARQGLLAAGARPVR